MTSLIIFSVIYHPKSSIFSKIHLQFFNVCIFICPVLYMCSFEKIITTILVFSIMINNNAQCSIQLFSIMFIGPEISRI